MLLTHSEVMAKNLKPLIRFILMFKSVSYFIYYHGEKILRMHFYIALDILCGSGNLPYRKFRDRISEYITEEIFNWEILK